MKKAQHSVGIFISIFFIIMIVIVFGTVLAGITESKSHEVAFNQLKDKIERICKSSSDIREPLTIYLPDSDGKDKYYHIKSASNYLYLKTEKGGDNPGKCSIDCKTIKSDAIDCKNKEGSLAVEPLFIDTAIGTESIDLVIKQQGTSILFEWGGSTDIVDHGSTAENR